MKNSETSSTSGILDLAAIPKNVREPHSSPGFFRSPITNPFFAIKRAMVELVCGQAIDPLCDATGVRRQSNVQNDQESQAL